MNFMDTSKECNVTYHPQENHLSCFLHVFSMASTCSAHLNRTAFNTCISTRGSKGLTLGQMLCNEPDTAKTALVKEEWSYLYSVQPGSNKNIEKSNVYHRKHHHVLNNSNIQIQDLRVQHFLPLQIWNFFFFSLYKKAIKNTDCDSTYV